MDTKEVLKRLHYAHIPTVSKGTGIPTTTLHYIRKKGQMKTTQLEKLASFFDNPKSEEVAQ